VRRPPPCGACVLRVGRMRTATVAFWSDAMVQTYILRTDVPPTDAVASGADVEICGACPLRPSTAAPDAATCYVNVGWLNALWRSWKDGKVPTWTPKKLHAYIRDVVKLPLRMGAYGDPARVDTEVWDTLAQRRGAGYSHQWRDDSAQGLAAHAMASVQSINEADDAHALGWRTYRVDIDGVGPQAGEIECPNTTRGVTCADCGLCNGNTGGGKSIMVKPIGLRVG
jgi:hypothetical protein